eukprot:gnl/TRDRNA2_/TRDRNA2_84887_c0_seq1.p1 gnl/TRDRNA2_/TRDRNA2_84887_c0~~gnl/TRDRNA2_/TRDRNA2_84887_c0_seq1.p1  ORF type:complete len:866 (-),score=231.75 gnl/TRDRNA2_/TRDRNA2_84887_c0_seq1:223-2820(-)
MHSSALPTSRATEVEVKQELNVQLQRRLAEESGERDAVKLALHRLKNTVNFYRERLLGLTRPTTGVDERATAQRGRELTKEMEAEVRSTMDLGRFDSGIRSAQIGSKSVLQQPGSPTRSYEVLRHSLQETQRRCESLNEQMMGQADSNDELVATLGTVKDANKRLLEQIRSQTTEISSLTQQRIQDEERLDAMMRQHQADRESIREDEMRQVNLVRDSATERYNKVHQLLTDKLRQVTLRGDIMQQNVAWLQGEIKARKSDALGLQEALNAQLRDADRNLVARCLIPVTRHETRKKAAEDAISDLNSQLKLELETRQKDSISWNHSHGSLATEIEGTQASLTRDLSQLGTQSAALQRMADLEDLAWGEERARLEREAAEALQKQHSRQADLERMKHDVIALESSISSALSDIANANQDVAAQRKKIRESDDFLAMEVSCNEHLRAQMEEWRRRIEEKNESDLGETQSSYEEKLNGARLANDADSTMTAKQAEAMELQSRDGEEQAAKLKSQLEVATAEMSVFEKDVAMWRAQFEAANNGRQSCEKELNDAKINFQADRLRLQATSERLQLECSNLEEETRQITGELQLTRRNAQAFETKATTQQLAAQSMLKDKQAQLAESELRLKDATELRAKITAEVNQIREREIESQLILERNFEGQARLAEDERRRLAATLAAQQRAAEQAREEFERERDSTMSNLRRVHDDSRSKLAGAERERARIEATCRTGLTEMHEVVREQQRHMENLERDLAKIRDLLTRSELDLAGLRQDRDRMDRDLVIGNRYLQDEVRNLANTLDVARRDDVSLATQLEAQQHRIEQERQTLQRTLDAVLDDVGKEAKRTLSPTRFSPLAAAARGDMAPYTAR